MRIKIDESVFIECSSPDSLLSLVRLFSRGRHQWVVTPQALTNASSFFDVHSPTMAQTYMQLAEKSLVSQMWISPQASPTVARVTDESLVDQVDDLSQPAVLVVEDLVSDGCFFRAIAQAFGYSDLIKALENRWLQIRHGGGKNRAEDCAKDEMRNYKHFLRVTVILDSDRLTPNEATACHTISKRLARRGIRCHVLEYRETENYVPNHALQGIKPFREISKLLDALKVLSPDQRAYFDMKKGFKVDANGKALIPQQQSDLYKNVPAEVLDKLTQGFGTQINTKMEEQSRIGRIKESHFSTLDSSISEELRKLLTMVQEIT